MDQAVPFGSFAKFRVRGAMLDSLRGLDWASRSSRRHFKRIETAKRELETALHREPFGSEVAEKLGVDMTRWGKMSLDMGGNVSFTAGQGAEQDGIVPDVPCRRYAWPDVMCAEGELSRFMKSALDQLRPRYRQVVMLYYVNDLTMKEVGERMGINESRVSQIHKVALEHLHVFFQENGITSAGALLSAAA
jgi:RNA polymerase sigma factor for flagellar operon FliA